MTSTEGFFSNPNVYQPESGAAAHSVSGTINLRCPHCQQLGSFVSPVAHDLIYIKAGGERKQPKQIAASIRQCPNVTCNSIVFVISGSEGQVLESAPPMVIDFDAANLPLELVSILREAIHCHAASAYRASAMMIRRLLEEICEANGATGDNLHVRLGELRNKITLPNQLFEAMFELKALGNDAAHIEAKAYNSIGEGEASDGIVLAKEILKSLYQLKDLVDRLKARKANPT